MKTNLRKVYEKERFEKVVGKLELQLTFTLFMLTIPAHISPNVKEFKLMISDYKQFDLKDGHFDVAKAVLENEIDYMHLALNYSVNAAKSKQLLLELQTVAKVVTPKK